MKEILLFVLSFLLLFVVYELYIVRRAKPRKDKKGKDKKIVEPMEVSYLVNRYHLDLEKVNYNKLLHVIAFTSSLDIVIVVSIVLFIKNFILQMIVGFICIFVVILLSYHIVYLIYKRGGMVKDGLQKNRK